MGRKSKVGMDIGETEHDVKPSDSQPGESTDEQQPDVDAAQSDQTEQDQEPEQPAAQAEEPSEPERATPPAPVCPKHQVDCVPAENGFYQCPQCDFRHRPMHGLVAAMRQRQAMATPANRNAR